MNTKQAVPENRKPHIICLYIFIAVREVFHDAKASGTRNNLPPAIPGGAGNGPQFMPANIHGNEQASGPRSSAPDVESYVANHHSLLAAFGPRR